MLMGKQSELNAAEFPTFLYDQGDRIGLLKRILKALGSPDQKFKIIHICGTNGKGSTAMMITAILKQMGHRVGLFTSPYIGEIYNGIQIDFKNIPSRIFEEKISVIKKLLRTAAFANVKVSEFEAQFLISMLYFAEQRVDYVVLECGLGGELDATNAVATTMYSIFTKISLDHVDILGNNITEIATTKSKIIRHHNVTITAQNQSLEALKVLENEAVSKQAVFLNADRVTITTSQQSKRSKQVHYRALLGHSEQSGTFRFGLAGTYQLENLATVLTWFFDFVKRTSFQQRLDDILAHSLAELVVPGRFETVQQKPKIILDGGHNPDGISAFVETVQKLYPNAPKLIVNGFLKDKSYEIAVQKLLTLKNSSFIITQPENQQRELSPVKLADVYQKYTNRQFPEFTSPVKAIKQAIMTASPTTVILVVGSFYLLNPIRTYLLSRSEYNGN